MRRLALGACGLLLLGCSDFFPGAPGADPSPGTYILRTVDGHALPTVTDTLGWSGGGYREFTISHRIKLDAGGDWTGVGRSIVTQVPTLVDGTPLPAETDTVNSEGSGNWGHVGEGGIELFYRSGESFWHSHSIHGYFDRNTLTFSVPGQASRQEHSYVFQK